MSGIDHWQGATETQRAEMTKLARQLVRGSMIEEAATRFMAMCMAQAIEETKRTTNPLSDPRVTALVDKAQAVINRWDSKDWKAPPTADTMKDLRAALAALHAPP
jgi:hypothetical protein